MVQIVLILLPTFSKKASTDIRPPAIAFIQKWLVDLFPEDYFKTYHVSSKIAHRQLRNTNKEFFH